MNHHAMPIKIGADDGGKITWNQAVISEKKLARYIDLSADMNPLPFLILDPAPNAPCSAVKKLRKAMDVRYCQMRWACGEGNGPWQPVMDLPPPRELQRLEAIADNMAAATNGNN